MDAELCDVFGVDEASLPEIGPSTGDLGTLCGLPLRAALVDQTAALAGHGCLVPGTIKATYGTGIFVLQNAGTAPPRDLAGVLPVVAWEHAGATTYALDGGVFSAGTVVDWLGAAGSGCSPNRPRRRPWPARSRTRRASRSCRRWPASARPGGGPTPAACSAG